MVADGDCSGLGGNDGQPVEQMDEPGAVGPVGAARSGLLARSAWSLIGQGLSSSSNFVLSVLVLSRASRVEFATLSVVLTTYTFLVLLLRSVVGLPVTLLYSHGLGRGNERDFRAAAGVTLVVSVVAGAALLVAAAVSPRDRGQLVVLGAALPLLLLQDAARYAWFAMGRPRMAAEADGLWVLLQVVGSALVLTLAGTGAPATLLLGAWAGAGAVSGCFLVLRTRLWPAPAAGYRWLVAHRALCGKLVTDYLVGAGSHYAVFFGLAVVAGSDELGRLKAAQTFLGPLIVLLLGGAVFGVPESVRAGADPARLWRLTRRLGGALVGASVACGAVVYAVLPVIGPATFPDAWAGARPAIPLLTVFAAAVGASTGATSGLRALDQNAWLLRARMLTGPVLVLASIPASASFGVNGALAVLSSVEWTVAVLSWRRLRGMLAQPA